MEHIVKVSPAGADGSASGENTSEAGPRGFLESVQIDYTTQHANTDVVLTEASGMARTLLTVSNNNTDVVKYPRVQVHDTSGAALTLDGTRASTSRIYLCGNKLTVTVAQGTEVTNGVIVRLLVSEY
jgi:hypothetical protein